MPQQLKHCFNEQTAGAIADDLARVLPGFSSDAFVAECLDRLEDLELLDRARHVAQVLYRHLPKPFPEGAKTLVASMGPENHEPEMTGYVIFKYFAHAFYLGEYGVDYPEESLDAQYELTKRFTAEFSIRGLLVKHPEVTLQRLRQWATDPNVHVRRLVSEGTRPRLPWAPRLPAFQQDPTPVLRLLELLKDDPEPYVRRSVANNLNDISKDHPHIAIDVCTRWMTNAGQDRKWIVNHALRTLVKQGNPQALGLLGAGSVAQVAVDSATITPESVAMGGSIRFAATVRSSSNQKQHLLIDYVVHFVKANGDTSEKVFKLTKTDIDPLGSIGVSGKVSFKPMTTRKCYPGRHHVELMINGQRFVLGDFVLLNS